MILALDIGGTAVKLGFIDKEGNLHARHMADIRFDGYRTPIFVTVLQAIDHFIREYPYRFEGIAVSATGQIETSTGVVIGTNGKIPNYEGTNLKGGLEEKYGVKTWVLNDANAAALGESFIGRAKGIKNAVMITIGTGVGGGVICNGKLLEGSRGIGGEVGHIPLYANGVLCGCGARGCYENYASTTALIRRCEEASGFSGLNGKLIFNLAAQDNPAIKAALHAWILDVAAGVRGLVHLFNPQMVLIGGGVSAQKELLIRPLRDEIFKQIMPRFREGLQIEQAALGNDAGMFGAVRFWLDREEGTG